MKTPKGYGQNQRHPIGAVRVRTRHSRNSERRAFIKISEPSKWILLARYVWEQAHGPIPAGMGIHHKDENKLNDELENLELVSKSKHLAIHRPAFRDRAIASFVQARKEQRWSTKSKHKRTGRHPANCQCPLHCP